MNLYHLSSKKGLKVLKARIPKSAMYYEDKKIKRVCFSRYISCCLSALNPFGIEKYYVYIPIEEVEEVRPDMSLVPDAKYTHEIWSLKDVKVKCIGQITRYKAYRHININFEKGQYLFRYFKWKWNEKYS
jgi:hypothetical protein